MIHSKENIQVISREIVCNTLPKRQQEGHKGTFGTGLLVAGTDDMPGSVTLSAIGAIRSGVGRLIVATSERAVPIVATHVPEATYVRNGLEEIANGILPNNIAAVGIGPGLTDRTLIRQALEQLLNTGNPIVVDAGALEKRSSWQAKGRVVVTPHPGEFSRMTGYSIEDINDHRVEYSKAYAKIYHVIVVLKGQHTVIAFPDGTTYVNPTGNTGLAKGGSGDVLTGILTSFIATHENIEHAVVNGVYVHGLCANIWAERYSESTMTASDYAQLLPIAMKRLEN